PAQSGCSPVVGALSSAAKAAAQGRHAGRRHGGAIFTELSRYRALLDAHEGASGSGRLQLKGLASDNRSMDPRRPCEPS
ncbi:MAG: hypothetical protein OET79_15695, partial [Nitrospirota bacterium]|nr:hypothetical protein [Nitrospirota bacterium]